MGGQAGCWGRVIQMSKLLGQLENEVRGEKDVGVKMEEEKQF